jgi:hypothetical protein
MTVAVPSKQVPKRRPSSREPAVREPPARTRLPGPAPKRPSAPHGRGGTSLFQVSFASVMSDPEIALLARALDLTTHMYPKMRPSPNSPGVARLDYYSGLFLDRGVGDGQWVLDARTWGHPAPGSVHEWHLLAAGAARLLDPTVTFPKRLAVVSPQYPMRPLGRAANKRSARIGRRILGLS